MKDINVLLIAPYLGLQETARKIAMKKPNVHLHTCVANVVEFDRIKKEIDNDNYDIIISRGGTARMIEQNTDIPVVEIQISMYDVLRVIKTTEGFGERFAIVGAASITNTAKLLCELLQYDLEIVSATGQVEAQEQIDRLETEGCQLIIGDMLSTSTAKQRGMNALLITSGPESVETAFDQAVMICRNYIYLKKEKDLFNDVIQYAPWDTLVLDGNNKILHNTMEESEYNKKVFRFISKSLPAFWDCSTSSFEQIIDQKLCRITAHIRKPNGQELLFVYVMNTYVPTILGDPSIRVVEPYREKNPPVDEFAATSFLGQLKDKIVAYARTRQPILIIGEKGTGKEDTAAYIYHNSTYTNTPFYEVDCEMMSAKSWNQLMTSTNSILLGQNATIYIKHIESLSLEQIQMLGKYILFAKTDYRNRLLFSLEENSKSISSTSHKTALTDALTCLVLKLPPLRERKDDISNLATIYINNMNREFGKSVINFDATAKDFLCSFPWPGNLRQFKQIIKELVILSQSSYITKEELQRALNEEQIPSVSLASSFDLSQSLEDITTDIIRIVVAEEGGNKSRAAKRLGIARNTLWRLLNK
ncbi:sigma-54-dependent Fis family transcriptional regulator [Ohessyouella blattaphilus]|uniref:PrpR N-terminal domain-containing protein n=1 Tax=Ohessyouella blattaphilus TaxID=2949333 RepID=A0ABT1EGC3_9FIRM|nr:sigma-54-dependent transcriptional regulator [Ohessyouella blattaphilus]MCP1109760.1 PrpR N-terminal domain-containing protein [Ohessyouella blattaphilus]MCR8563154.1 PrpR N-terminal domain-containing protein [Ohessyouella blattaphilus]